MRPLISTAAAPLLFALLSACGGRTILDDPSDELPLPNGGHPAGSTSGQSSSGGETDSGAKTDGGSSNGTVACGTKTCESATQDCCGTMSGMSAALACVAKGTCAGVTTSCMETSDCPEGDKCCASAGGAGGISSLAGATSAAGLDIQVSCKASCGTGITDFQLCASDMECAKGVTCQSTAFGANLCGGLGVIGMFLGDAGGAGFPGL
jgi:hypothetical protein